MRCHRINDRSIFIFSLLLDLSKLEVQIHDHALEPRTKGEPVLLLGAEVVVVILEAKVGGRVQPGTFEP